MPRSKPVWLTELGCPAVDRGANRPSVFPDPKSSESGLPPFSNGDRDDLMQRRLLEALDRAGIGVSTLAVHFHDTYGQALANTLAALADGVRVVDSSAGGLGGCPYAKSATGNLATEDLVWGLHGAGVRTGVDLESLVQTSAWMAAALGRPSAARVVRALAPPIG